MMAGAASTWRELTWRLSGATANISVALGHTQGVPEASMTDLPSENHPITRSALLTPRNYEDFFLSLTMISYFLHIVWFICSFSKNVLSIFHVLGSVLIVGDSSAPSSPLQWVPSGGGKY